MPTIQIRSPGRQVRGRERWGAEANDPAALRSNPLPQFRAFRRLCGKYENTNHIKIFPESNM
jgi:hypothetical protein